MPSADEFLNVVYLKEIVMAVFSTARLNPVCPAGLQTTGRVKGNCRLPSTLRSPKKWQDAGREQKAGEELGEQ